MRCRRRYYSDSTQESTDGNGGGGSGRQMWIDWFSWAQRVQTLTTTRSPQNLFAATKYDIDKNLSIDLAEKGFVSNNVLSAMISLIYYAATSMEEHVDPGVVLIERAVKRALGTAKVTRTRTLTLTLTLTLITRPPRLPECRRYWWMTQRFWIIS